MNERTADGEPAGPVDSAGATEDLSAAPATADSVDRLLARAVEAPPEFPALASGTLVAGRYEIECVLGAGGMGTVYLARDGQLDRPVALKLHRTASASERLRREALAMAKLAHPNVVTVFEIGELDGRAFVAMEYVRGATLRQWLTDGARTPRETLAALLAAGDGLAAAHAAGLVHRDVKPDNIFVGADGRVRIGDFGLAQLGGRETTGSARGVQIVALATAPGAVLGTPAYMSPEQIAGGEIDARTDQFAYCVAAWEALGGKRPFDGANTDALETAIKRGAPERPRRRIAPLIRRVLERGMSPDPEARWPSMQALLAALRSAERRPRLTAIAIGSTLAIGAAAAWSLRPTAGDPGIACTLAGEDIDVIVPAAAVEGAAATPTREGRVTGAEETTRIRKAVDDFRAGYRELAGITCRARERGQWSESSTIASSECARLRAHTQRELLAAAADRALQPANAIQLVLRAPSLRICGDPRLLATWRPLGGGDDILAARARLDAAFVLVDIGELAAARRVRDDGALAIAAAANADVARRLALLRARLADLAASEPALARVLDAARTDTVPVEVPAAAGDVPPAGGTPIGTSTGMMTPRAPTGGAPSPPPSLVERADVDVVLAAYAQLIDRSGRIRRDRKTTDRWIRDGVTTAQALASRAPVAAFDVAVAAAAARTTVEDHKQAIELADIAEKIGIPDEVRRLALLEVRSDALGGVKNAKRAADAAASLVERAHVLYGPGHPRVAHVRAIAASTLGNTGGGAQSLAAARSAAKITDDNRQDFSLTTALAEFEVASRLRELDDGLALGHYNRARAAFAATGVDDPLVADAAINLALVYIAMKNTELSLPLLREATAMQARMFGPDHRELVEGLYDLAIAQRLANDHDGSIANLERTLAIVEKHEPRSQLHAQVLLNLAHTLGLAKRPEKSLDAANAALALDIRTDLVTPAWARLETARALIALGRDRPRTIVLLREARSRYEFAQAKEQVAEIDKLLGSLH